MSNVISVLLVNEFFSQVHAMNEFNLTATKMPIQNHLIFVVV